MVVLRRGERRSEKRRTFRILLLFYVMEMKHLVR